MSESTETTAPPAPEPKALPASEPKALPAPAIAAKPGRSAWPVVFALGFLALAGGEGYLWYNAQAHQADTTTLAVLRAQLDDLRAAAARTASAPDSVVVQADLAQKYIALAAQLNAVQAQAADDHGALSLMQANAVDLGRLTQRMTVLNALETARMALDEGQPLGQIPGAPQALAQFAELAPPTEAQLRENFAAAAKAANEASLSANGKASFWAGVKLRLEGLITVSDGAHVLFGPPAAGALLAAQQALEAGDLGGAVMQVQSLSPAARQAMAGWLTQAQDLLAARAALISMAQGA